jgi:hypothetical protein
MLGEVDTVTTTVFREAHPPDTAPMTVYVVVAVGEAVTVAPAEPLNVAVGLHV